MADTSLANLYKSLRERNAGRSYYAPVAASVLQADVTDPRGSVGSNFAANLVKGLIGGYMGNLYRQEQEDYDTALTQGLGSMLRGGGAFSAALPKDDVAAISAFKLARDLERDEKVQSLYDEIKLAGYKKRAEEEAVLGAQLEQINQIQGLKAPGETIGGEAVSDGLQSLPDGGVLMKDGSKVSASPKKASLSDYKILAGSNPLVKEAVRQEEESIKRNTSEEDNARMELLTKTPSVAQFAAMQKALPLVEGFKDQDTKSSDVGFVYNYVKALDDGAVRGEEINMASSSNPVIKKFRTQLEGALKGTSELTPQLKNEMYKELKQAQKNVYAQALADSQRRLDIVRQRGGNPNFASPIPLDLKFDIPEMPATMAPTSGKLKASDLIAQGYIKTDRGWINPKVKSVGGTPLG